MVIMWHIETIVSKWILIIFLIYLIKAYIINYYTKCFKLNIFTSVAWLWSLYSQWIWVVLTSDIIKDPNRLYSQYIWIVSTSDIIIADYLDYFA